MIACNIPDGCINVVFITTYPDVCITTYPDGCITTYPDGCGFYNHISHICLLAQTLTRVLKLFLITKPQIYNNKVHVL